MTSLKALRREHRIIGDALAGLAKAAARLDRGDAVPPELLGRFVRFFEAFGGCHNGKEEAVLFPFLDEACGHDAIDGLQVQHRVASEFLRRMRHAVGPSGRGPAIDRYAFSTGALAYGSILGEHMAAEEQWFDVATRLLTRKQDGWLTDRFGKIETDSIGLEARARYQTMARDLFNAASRAVSREPDSKTRLG